MNQKEKNKLLELFSAFITKIERNRTVNWRLEEINNKVLIRCENSTKDFFFDIPTSVGVLAMWNSIHRDLSLKEIEKYCVEDDERWTRCYWELEYVEL